MLMLLFALQPVTTGAWFTFIPEIQAALGINKAELSLALLGMPIAWVVSLQWAGILVSRLGPRRLMMIAFPAQVAAMTGPMVAPTSSWLFASLTLVGLSVGLSTVALNVYAGRMERQSGRLIMSRCHGAWALGLMTGSFLVTMLPDFALVVQVLILGIPAVFVALWIIGGLSRLAEEDRGPKARLKFKDIPRSLIIVICFTFPITMLEGAMQDWSAIYLAERMEAGAGLGVTVFSGFLALGRFSGDYLKARFGAVVLARGTISLAFIGLVLLVFAPSVAGTFVALALVGFGTSAVFPLAISAAGELKEGMDGPYIAFLSSCVVFAFVLGPPLIGFAAEAITLRWAFALMIPGVIVSLILAGGLHSRDD